MSLVPKETLLSHLQRAEGAEEVTLPIDFFRDLLYQAMPRTWVGLTDEEIEMMWQGYCKQWKTGEKIVINFVDFACAIEAKLKEKNT